MDWIQFVTNMISIGAPLAGAVYIFYSITKSRIDRMEDFHREDIKIIREDMKSFNDALLHLDEKWERLFEKMDTKWEKMDTKWERLFERFFIQDQRKKVK